MSQLFDTGKIALPPVEERIRVLLWGRENLEHSEDNWTTDDLCKVRAQLPPEWHGMDLVILKNRLQQDRRDKRCPKVKPPKEFVERFEKLLRDFIKNRERQGTGHLSQDYLDYLDSPEWKDKSREHKERCNWCCQLCGRQNYQLDTHHTTEGYRHLHYEKPWHLLAVCREPCHPIADMMRQDWLHQHGNDEYGFFSEDDTPDL